MCKYVHFIRKFVDVAFSYVVNKTIFFVMYSKVLTRIAKISAGTFHKSHLNNVWVERGANNARKIGTNMLEIGGDS